MSAPYSSILTPTLKHTLGDEVVASLRDAILTGRLPPGERLSEEALAKSLNVSRGPIREALDRLEREGLVITQSNRRTFVARLSRADLEEVYSLRTALELLAVREAVRHAGADDLAELQAIVDTMAAHVESGITEQEAAEMDVRFHGTLYRAGKHKRLYESWANLRPQVHILLLSRNVANADFRDLAISSHQAIVGAIRDRDERRAVALMQVHLQASYDRVVASYDHADTADGPESPPNSSAQEQRESG